MIALDRKLAPLVGAPNQIELIQAETLVVSSGVNIHRVQAGVLPVVKLEFIFPSRLHLETFPGVSQFTLKMLAEGTLYRSSKEIKEAFAFYGAHLDTQHGVDRSSLIVHTLGKHLEAIVPLIMELLTAPSFPSDELETLKKNTIQNLKINGEKTAILAQIAFKELLYGKAHPYGHSLTIQDVESISISPIKEFYEKAIRNVPLDVVIAGFLTDQEMGVVEKAIHGWSATEIQVDFPEKLSPEIINPSRKVVQKPGSMQASLRLGRRSVPKSNPDYFNLVIINKILGGYFGSRLMKNIREDKGYTYGISSVLAHFNHADHWVIGADVKNEVAEKAVEEIYKEMHKLSSEPISPSELETVKQYMIGTFISSSNTPFQLADKFKNIYFSGLGYGHYAKYIAAVTNANSNDLLRTAKEWLDKDQFVEVISGDIN